MKKIILLLSFLYSFSVIADNHVPSYSVMESFQCNVKQGRSLDDVNRVNAEWAKWAESGNLSVQYNAWQMTGFFQNKNDFDFTHGWIGFTNNYEDMGTIQDEWLANGSRLQSRFESVEDCGVHAMYYVYVARSPTEPFSDGFMTVSGCNLEEGTTNEQFLAADAKWNAYLDENGFSNGLLMRWIPGSGSGINNPYDYLQVFVSPSFKEWGSDVDKLVTGAGAYSASLYGDLASCDTPRIYRSTYVGGYNPE